MMFLPNNGTEVTIGTTPDITSDCKQIKWVVLAAYNHGGVKLMTRKPIYYDKSLVMDFCEKETWLESKLRTVLNSKVYETIFSDKEKECIILSSSLDEEIVIYSFESNTPKYEGVLRKHIPTGRKDYIFLPSMHDLFWYECIGEDIYINADQYELQNSKYSLERDDDNYLLLNPVYKKILT